MKLLYFTLLACLMPEKSWLLFSLFYFTPPYLMMLADRNAGWHL